MSGNLCPFMSTYEESAYCMGSCKFYSEKLRDCLIKESLETVLAQQNYLEDIKHKLINIQDEISNLD